MLTEDAVYAIRKGGEPTRFDLPDGRMILAAIGASGLLTSVFDPKDKPLPGHISQRVQLYSTASFIDYVNGYKADDTVVFADPNDNSLCSVINYHKTPIVGKSSEDEKALQPAPALPDYADHRALMSIPFSEQWKRWSGIDGKALSQAEFAEFLEENYMDVATPDHATLLEIVSTLQAKNDVAFGSAIKLQNGETQFTYTEKIEGKGKGELAVPSEFKLSIPIHFEGAAKDIRCFLRYRIPSGVLSFIVKINRRELLQKEAFTALVQEIGKATDIVPVYGKTV